MKKLTTIILLIMLTVTSKGQGQASLPAGSVAYGNTLYKDPNNKVWGGIGSLLFREIALQYNVDNALLLKRNVNVPITWTEITGKPTIVTSEVDPTVPAYVKSITLSEKTNWNNAQPFIPVGTNMQYWRGDKTWQTLNTDVVPEGTTNKYYTDAKVDARITGKQNSLSGSGIVKSSAGTISYLTDNSSNWNAAFAWGNHAGLYPTYAGAGAIGTWNISVTGNSANSSTWSSQNFTNSPGATFSYFMGFDGANWGRMTAAQAENSMGWTKANWNAAYSWGDHALAGYSTPSNTQVFTNKTWNGTQITEAYISSASTWNAKQNPLNGSGIVKSSGGTISYITDNGSNWNTAYSWGNHATAGYLTSYTETDPTVADHVKAITTTQKSNWDLAYGWGNHAAAGYELGSNKSTNILLGLSDMLYPSQKAVKTYVDNEIAGINSTVQSGTYTPILYLTLNTDSATPRLAHYIKVGNQVTVTGTFDFVPTGSTIYSTVAMTLPLTSDLGTSYDISGTGSSDNGCATNVFVRGNASTNEANVQLMNNSSSGKVFFTFTYTII